MKWSSIKKLKNIKNGDIFSDGIVTSFFVTIPNWTFDKDIRSALLNCNAGLFRRHSPEKVLRNLRTKPKIDLNDFLNELFIYNNFNDIIEHDDEL